MALSYILPSAVRTTGAGVTSSTIAVPQDAALRANLVVTASSGPTTLDVSIEHSEDGGTTWITVGSFTQVGAVGTASQSISIAAPTSGLIRAKYTIVGTSYTFSLSIRDQSLL